MSYWKTSPERYAVEMDIYNRRQAGEYISYGKEQVILDKAKAEYLQKKSRQGKNTTEKESIEKYRTLAENKAF